MSSRERRAWAASIALAGVILPAEARADPYALRGDLARDATIAGATLGMLSLSEIALKQRLAPVAPRWSDRGPDGEDTLNALDKRAYALRWRNPEAAGKLSDFGLFAVTIASLSLTATIGGIEGQRPGERALDVAIVTESAAVAMAINQATKFIAGRERPCKHYASPGAVLPCGPDRRDENLSSFSGHTTLVSSLTVAAGTVSALRGYRLAPLLFGASALLTVGTGYLRIAAGKHYLTDVLVGAILGSAVGFFVPYTFHGRLAAAPGGGAPSLQSFGFSGAF